MPQDFQHIVPVFMIAGKRTDSPGNFGACQIGMAGHNGGQGGRLGPPLFRVIGQALSHQQRPEIGIADTDFPVGPGILGNLFGRITGIAA